MKCVFTQDYTPCPAKRDQYYFGRNFEKFRQLLIIIPFLTFRPSGSGD